MKGEHGLPAGTPVSLDWEGYIQRGGGFGIYRNVTYDTHEEMPHLKVEVLAGHYIVSASDGKLSFQYYEDNERLTSFADKPLPDAWGNPLKVDHLIKMNDTKLVLVGSNSMLPITIKDDFDGTNHHIDAVYGQLTRIFNSRDPIFAHADNLDGDRVAYIFEDLANFKIMAGFGTWVGEGKEARMQLSDPVVAAEEGVYSYHGVAGMSTEKFIIAATGFKNNGTGPIEEPFAPIRMKVGHIDWQSQKVVFSDWNIRIFSDNVNWFALDNFNQNMAVIAYYDHTEGDGVVAMAVFLDGDSVRYGGYTIIEHGGALKPESSQRMALRILSHDRFGIVFPDASNNGNLIFMMGERTANNDMQRIGSNFIIARNNPKKQGYFWFAVAPIDWNHFVIVDSFDNNEGNYATANVGYHLAYPVGLTSDRSSKHIQFHGVFKYKDPKMKLVPGYVYYTNSMGRLIRGSPYGYNHGEFGNFYVVSRWTREICALHNQIGIAVSEKELLIRTY